MLNTNRRDLVMGAAALFGSSLVVPLALAATVAGAQGSPAGFTASHSFFTSEQRALVAVLSEGIIPTTDTPGAIAAGVPGFMEMMLADWYEPTDRNEFMAGLGVIDGYARVRYGRHFAGLNPAAQDAILTLAMERAIPGLSSRFFEHSRQMVILGYYSSEIGCKQERIYLPVPGRYDGAYPYAEVRRVFSS